MGHYCNFPIRTSGVEGSLSLEKPLNQQRFHLELAQVLIRHGDRTSSVFIPNMDNGKYDYNCTFRTKDNEHKQMFQEYAKTARHFVLRDFLKGVKTFGRLLPSGQRCRVSEMTQRGFIQHFTLGKHLRTAYSSLINSDIKSGNLHVRSTSRTRCVQSAAAFLYGLLTKDTIMKGETAQWMNVGYDISIILVPRDRAPFGQHQEWRPMARSYFLSMRRVFISYSQPIRFVRFHGKSVNRGLPVLDQPRGAQRSPFLMLTKRSAASGEENANVVFLNCSRHIVWLGQEFSPKWQMNVTFCPFFS